MSRHFAVLNGNTVSNVILADVWDGIDVTDISPRPSQGWTYSGGTFLPPAPTVTTASTIRKHLLLKRMTPAEVHAWFRAFQRASATNTPVAADRNALYAWLRWDEMDGEVDMSSADIQGLKTVWVALGMAQARADAILAPYAAGTEPA